MIAFLGFVVLFIGVIIITLFLSTKAPRQSLRIISKDGRDSPYYKGLWKNERIYYTVWIGDGLLGSYKQTELEGAKASNFVVIDLKVKINGDDELVVIPIGTDGTSFYHEENYLPFNPTNGNLTAIFKSFTTTVAYITKNQVFSLSDGSYSDSLGIDPQTFAIVQDSSYQIQMQSYFDYAKDKNKVYYYITQSLCEVDGADANSFQKLPPTLDANNKPDAKDNYRTYRRGTIFRN